MNETSNSSSVLDFSFSIIVGLDNTLSIFLTLSLSSCLTCSLISAFACSSSIFLCLSFTDLIELDKFNVSLQSNSSVYFYLLDNEDIYLRVEKLNKEEYYDSYNKGILEELNNSYKYKYKYLRNNKSYYKLTIKNFDSKDYGYLDLRFKYMSDSFDILN